MPAFSVSVESAVDDGMVTVHVAGTVADATSAGLFHPSCRHSLSAYLPGATKVPTHTADPQGDAARQRLRDLERRVRKQKLLADAAIDPVAGKEHAAKARALQGQIREHVAATRDMGIMRKPEREKPDLGFSPPAAVAKPTPAPKPKPVKPPPADGLDAMELHSLRGLGGEFEIPNAATLPKTQLVAALRKQGAVSPEHRRAMQEAERIQRAQAVRGASEDALQKAIASGVKAEKVLAGGDVSETSLVTFRDGTRLVRKKTTDEGGDPGSGKESTDAEYLAARIGRVLRAPVPVVHRVDDATTYMQYVDHARTGFEVLDGLDADAERARLGKLASTDSGKRLGLLDLLASNRDRHNGNWLIGEDGNLEGIDHGLAWESIDLVTAGDSRKLAAGSAFAEPYLKLGDFIDNDLSPADVVFLRSQLGSLEDVFRELGRANWHEFTMSRFEAIAAKATGTINRYAP